MRPNLLVLSITGAIILPACNCGKPNTLADTNGILSLDSNELDFGPVTEFTQKTLPIHISNTGKGTLTIMSATLDTTSSADFTLGTIPMEVEPNAAVDIPVTFSPLGAGDDTGSVALVTDDPDHPNASISLHGGPIFPVLEFDPDAGYLGFAPTSMQFTAKMAAVRSVGGSTLHVTAVGVNGGGNPDFSVVPPALPAAIKPGQAIAVEVDYSRSMRTSNGILEVVNDGADGGLSQLLLLPDPAHQCGDGIDNDNDGLIDFPDDPGCTSQDDDDEYNPPECIDGGMRPCGSTQGTCKQGEQTCAHSVWGTCAGGVAPMPETCNGLDDNCNGVTDEGISETCTIFGCPGARACLVDAGIPDGGYTACIPVTAMPEICNGIDDNCNGQIDEGISQLCTINGCPGIRICIPGGDGGFTSCMPSAPTQEICDGIDNDCNGIIDDVMPAVQFCGFGVCRRAAPACVDGGTPVCMPGMGSMEVCNGIDDDCDGVIDNGIAQLTCGTTGQCVNAVNACLADGGMNICMPNPPSGEVCDNVDNNCNGVKDEGADGGPLSVVCYDGGSAATRNVGSCHDGFSLCSSGAYGGCSGQQGPTAEVCGNMVDENCNGPADDVCPDGGCNPTGLWHLDGGALSYTCCFGEVSLNISQFMFADAGSSFRVYGKPTQPYTFITSPTIPVCPTGGFTATRTAVGGCTETYTLSVTFTSDDTWQGTYSATYTGATCTDPTGFPIGCGAQPCISQTWPVQGYR